MEHRRVLTTSFQFSVFMVTLCSVVSQLTIDGKVYKSELPDGCPLKTQKYLEQFGYLSPERVCIKEDIEAALRQFQSLNYGSWNVTVTGRCDAETLELMLQPRCGCEDIRKFEKKMMPNSILGPAEFNIGQSKWTKKTLTWRVLKYPVTAHNRHISHPDIDDAMRRALQIWADQTTLSFHQITTGNADITIKFEVSRHTREPPFYDFDGQGNVLAHAFFPMSGVVHFDDDEHYVLNSDQGTELYIVAAHEFGHTLGISHSNIKEALMAPYYRYSDNLKLHPDDIAAIQTLYGRKENNNTPRPTQRPTPKPTPKPTQHPVPENCKLRIKASFSIGAVTYIFTRERIQSRQMKTFVYKVTSRGIDFASKTPIERMFQKKERALYPRAYPYRVDAAEYIPDKKQIYLFSGTRAYRYNATNNADMYMLDRPNKYPRWMDVTEFPERPRAAVVMPYSGYNGYYMLIFGTTMVWDWNLYSERVGAWAYPIDVFGRNMPQRVDGALYQRQGNTIKFFKGDRFYKFDVDYRRITDDTVYYIEKDFYKGKCAQ